jgi:hypothetical protein
MTWKLSGSPGTLSISIRLEHWKTYRTQKLYEKFACKQCMVVLFAHHYVVFIAENPILFLLSDENHFIKEEDMSDGFSTIGSEGTFGTKLTVCRQIFPLRN